MIQRYFLFFLCAIAALQLPAQVKIGDNALDFSTPKEYTIGGITVSGTEKLDANAIILLSGLAIGQKITVPGEKTGKAIKNLWQQNLFSDIKLTATKIEGENIFLDIYIQERPRLSKFKFEGVKKTEADNLREEINLFKEKIITENLKISTQRKIEKYFIDKGYLDVQVVITEEVDPNMVDHRILTLDVQKNKKVKINKIYVEGNEVISSQKVIKSMKETKEKFLFRPLRDVDGLFAETFKQLFNGEGKQIPFTILSYLNENVKFRLFKSSKFIDKNFEEDQELIIAKYNSKGYRDAKIAESLVQKSGDGLIDIRLKIDEGNQYYFRNIRFTGNKKYTSQQLLAALGIKKGDIYNSQKLESKIYGEPNGTDISSIYMDDGYLFFQIMPVEVFSINDSIDLEIRISEGKQATINKVYVTGNTRTNDHVIIRELRSKPGLLFSKSDIIRSQRELSVLGYFDPESMNVIPKPNPENGTVDIEYVVSEAPNDQIELSGGWGGGFLVGSLGVSFNNFSVRNVFKGEEWRPYPRGDGQRLSLRGQSSGAFFSSYNISFTEPWLGGKKPNAFSVTGYFSTQSNGQRRFLQDSTDAGGNRVQNPLRNYINILGTTVGLGSRLQWPDDYFIMRHEISYQYFEMNNWQQFVFSTGFSNNLYYRFTLSRNSVDQAIYPRMGSNITLAVQATPPFSLMGANQNRDYGDMPDREKYLWVEYHKWKFTSSWFTTLVGNLVLYNKIGFGFLGSYNSDIGTAPFERFYLGGSGLTGFALDGREIIALRGYDDRSVSPVVGSSIISKYTTEIRFPFTLNPSATIYSLAFFEAGNTWSGFNTYNPFEVNRSAGVGVRFFLPMFGLLGLDWGYRFDDIPNNPGMQRSQIHFTIGANLGEL